MWLFCQGIINMVEYNIGDRISLNGNEGTVARVKILGMVRNQAIQVTWDDPSKVNSIIQIPQLNDVVKL